GCRPRRNRGSRGSLAPAASRERERAARRKFRAGVGPRAQWKKGNAMRRYLTLAAVIAVLTAWPHAQITGQTPVPNRAPTGPTPRTPSGHPDLSGVWQ